MIYVPSYTSNNCLIVYNTDIIRVYDNVPTYNSDVSYTDYYIKSNYISNRGTTHFSNYSTLPTCYSNNEITTNYWYRSDMPNILLMFSIIVIFGLYIPWRIFLRLFRRLQ